MNYRKVYESSLNLRSLPTNFDVHHIDINRDNNNISNLVALPKELHHKYHKMMPFENEITFDTVLQSIVDFGHARNQFTLDLFCAFNEIREECNKWLDYKNHLLGVLPNIHNLRYGKDV